jgi:hypothetical protein
MHPALLHEQVALLSALSWPGLLQTRLPSATVTITVALYRGGPLPPRRLTLRASLEETAWLIQWCGLAIAIGKCHFEAIECGVVPRIVH